MSSPSTLFKTASSDLAGFFSHSTSLLLIGAPGLQTCVLYLCLYLSSGDLNSGPQACTPSVLPLSHLPLQHVLTFYSYSGFVSGQGYLTLWET